MLITHDLGVVAEMCDRVVVMYSGQVVEEGETRAILKDPKHPYTKGLIRSCPIYEEKYKNFIPFGNSAAAEIGESWLSLCTTLRVCF